MTKDPLVSVVIPAYNRARTIGACLQSVRGQTHQDWEAIVVDDGSIDGTSQLVERLAHDDDRIRLIRHDRNRGAQAARNTGIRAATKGWVAFLDSDDQLLPTSIELRLQAAVDAEVSVVHSACLVNKDGVTEPYGVPPLRGPVYTRLLEGEGPVFPTFLVRKDALQRIGYLDERILSFQEWETAIRLAKHYEFAFVAEPTFVYDCRGSDTISKDLRRAGRGYEQVFHKHCLAILRHAGPGTFARHYQIAADWYQRAGYQRGVRRCRRMALLWTSLDRQWGRLKFLAART